MVRILVKICKALSTLLIVIAAILAALLLGCRLFGVTPFTVLSGSMEPTYHTGALLYVKDAEPADVAVGDPITFYFKDGAAATHRVIKIDTENRLFYTKGDANNTADAPVSFDALIGKPVFSIPYLGVLALRISKPEGKVIAGAVAVFMLGLLFLPDLLPGAKEKKSA